MHLDCLPSDSDVLIRNALTAGTGIDTSQQDSGGHICDGKIPKFSLIGKEWKYRGEGNGSLVLAITKAKKIVRITKVDKHGNLSFRDSAEVKLLIPCPSYPTGSLEETMEKLLFSNNIMGRMLGASLVKEGHLLRMDESEVDLLMKKLPDHRPANRIHKHLNPLGLVVLYPDCTLLQGETPKDEFPTYCVEIKPKQGFKSSPAHSRCPFCLNQFLKAKNGKIARRSSYCPLDLFSGSYKRMVRAARELIRTPQNNLRIFKDGELVLSEENSGQAQTVLEEWLGTVFSCENNAPSDEPFTARSFLNFAHLTIQAFTRPLPEKSQPISSPRNCDATSKNGYFPSLPPFIEIQSFSPYPGNATSTTSILDPCEIQMENLPKNCLLERLLRIQKLGEIAADCLYEAYDTVAVELENKLTSIDRLRWSHGDYDNLEWIFNDSYLSEFEKSLKIIQRYRILATTRDCSIMVLFKRVDKCDDDEKVIVTDLEGRRYQCQISVVDLDPKPITCVLKHRRRERSMTEAYSQSVRESKACEERLK